MMGHSMRSSRCYGATARLTVAAIVGALVLPVVLLSAARTGAVDLAAAHRRAVVCALSLVQDDASDAAVDAAFSSRVNRTRIGEMDAYESRTDGALTGLALEMVGEGFRGQMKGILAIDPSLKKILGVRIYKDKETKKRGGKIKNVAWLSKFNGLSLIREGGFGVKISSKEKGPNVVDSITGATRTVHGLKSMINSAIAGYLAGGVLLEPLDLDLGVDAVTRATPGYPKHLKNPPHLRKEVKRETLFVSVGVTNLALGRPVSCGMEDEPIIGELDQITDGIKKSGPFDFVELDPGPQWVQIDLGKRQTVQAIAVWHFYKNPTIYNDVIVQVADDAEFANNVRTLFNNDHDDSTGLGAGKDTAYYARWWSELVDARGDDKKGTPARYVRVYSNGGASIDDMTRFVEIQIYGEDK